MSRSVNRTAIVAALTLFVSAAAVADEIRVMTSGASAAAYLALVPEFERSTHHTLRTEATMTGVGADTISARVRRGDPVDVVILSSAQLDDLIKDGKVLADSRVDLARSAIGMAVRAGAPKPDLGSVDALKRLLLQARSIAYSASVSGTYLSTELFPRLGIAKEMAAKSVRVEREPVGNVVARGEAEVGFQQVSELLAVKGITFVGPLPGDAQRITVFSAGVAAASKSPEAARALIRFLTSPTGVRAMTTSGLDPIAQERP
jgi:molybdate transport system substrate-binding protein